MTFWSTELVVLTSDSFLMTSTQLDLITPGFLIHCWGTSKLSLKNKYFSHLLGKSSGLNDITNHMWIGTVVLCFSLLPLLLRSYTYNRLRFFINQWKLHKMEGAFLLHYLWWKLPFQKYVIVSKYFISTTLSHSYFSFLKDLFKTFIEAAYLTFSLFYI